MLQAVWPLVIAYSNEPQREKYHSSVGESKEKGRFETEFQVTKVLRALRD